MGNQPTGAQSLIGVLLPFVILMAVWYFMLIRPQQQQKKTRDAMLAGLRKGNRVISIGGIYGEIIDIKDDVLLVNISEQGERMTVRFAKWAVQDVLGKDQAQSQPQSQA